MSIFVNMAFANPSDEMSRLHVLHYIHSSGGFDHLDDSVGSLFSPYVAGGVPEPETVYIANWASEKWSKGAYATVMAPGVWTGFQIPFGRSLGRIYFAGTETTDKTYAYLDGAVRSGKRAAKEIIG